MYNLSSTNILTNQIYKILNSPFVLIFGMEQYIIFQKFKA